MLTFRDGTVNYRAAMRSFLDMSNIGSYRVSVCHVENIEFDGGEVEHQESIAKVKNCDGFLFEANQASGFGSPANIESLILATDSRITLRNNARLSSLTRPLVRTLDRTSFVYSYESNLDLTNTAGFIDPDSQSGNLIPALVSGTDVTIQGDRASAMAHSVFVAELTGEAAAYTVGVARLTDSFNQGFMTKGQVFTIVFVNNSSADLGMLNFNAAQFFVEKPLPAPPSARSRLAMTFFWDGATARELFRQERNPAWVYPKSSTILSPGKRRVAADASGGDMTVTLPRADTVQLGARFLIKKTTEGNTVFINSTAGFTIDGAPSYALSQQWAVIELESDGAQWLVV